MEDYGALSVSITGAGALRPSSLIRLTPPSFCHSVSLSAPLISLVVIHLCFVCLHSIRFCPPTPINPCLPIYISAYPFSYRQGIAIPTTGGVTGAFDSQSVHLSACPVSLFKVQPWTRQHA